LPSGYYSFKIEKSGAKDTSTKYNQPQSTALTLEGIPGLSGRYEANSLAKIENNPILKPYLPSHGIMSKLFKTGCTYYSAPSLKLDGSQILTCESNGMTSSSCGDADG
jgi:hypothetical protein